MKGLSRMLCVGLVCAAVWIVRSDAHAQEKTYQSERYNYTIRYPSDFECSPLGDIITFASKKVDKKFSFAHNVNIMVGSLGKETPALDDFYAMSKARLQKNLVNVEFVEEKDSRVGAFASKRLVYITKQKQAMFKILQEMFIHNNRVYVLTFTDLIEGYNAHLPQAEKMIKSFKVHD